MILRLMRRVWALLPRGAAGDKQRPNPLYVVDPGSRLIHRVGGCRVASNDYGFLSLASAMNAGGGPCHQCLSDWEDVLEKEARHDCHD